jgi:hypothetical protein
MGVLPTILGQAVRGIGFDVAISPSIRESVKPAKKSKRFYKNPGTPPSRSSGQEELCTAPRIENPDPSSGYTVSQSSATVAEA